MIANNRGISMSMARSSDFVTKEEQLLDACKNGDYSTAEILIFQKIENIDAQDDGAGATPLHWAANNGDRDIAELLLDNGADVNVKTDCGVTPLHLACYHGGSKSVIKLLLDNGASYDAKDDDGYNALHYAGIKDDIVDLLEERGARKDVIIEEIRSARSKDDDDSVIAIGTLNVAKLYQKKGKLKQDIVRIDNSRTIAGTGSSTNSLIEFDVFLSHCWGEDIEGRDNHERVALIHDAFKRRGIKSWFDSENMEGNIIDEMSKGIDKSNCIIVFVTRNYITKVAGDGANGNDDNCKMEFEYAKRRKGSSRIITVVMEASCSDQSSWHGPVGMVLGGDLYHNFFDDEQLEACVDSLVEKIRSCDQ